MRDPQPTRAPSSVHATQGEGPSLAIDRGEAIPMHCRHSRRANCLAICIVLPLAAACAANTVKPITEARLPPMPPPPLVLVYDPAFHDPGAVQSGITVGVVLDRHNDHL